jgi:hypothetical protein
MCIMARYLVMLVASAGILGGALALAGAADAATTDVHHLQDLQPGYTR